MFVVVVVLWRCVRVLGCLLLLKKPCAADPRGVRSYHPLCACCDLIPYVITGVR